MIRPFDDTGRAVSAARFEAFAGLCPRIAIHGCRFEEIDCGMRCVFLATSLEIAPSSPPVPTVGESDHHEGDSLRSPTCYDSNRRHHPRGITHEDRSYRRSRSRRRCRPLRRRLRQGSGSGSGRRQGLIATRQPPRSRGSRWTRRSIMESGIGGDTDAVFRSLRPSRDESGEIPRRGSIGIARIPLRNRFFSTGLFPSGRNMF